MLDEKTGVNEQEVIETPSITESDVQDSDGQNEESPSQGGGVNTDAPKTFSEEEVNKRINEVLHERTKKMSAELESYRNLGTPRELFERMAKMAEASNRKEEPKPEAKEEELTEEDKEFDAYFKRYLSKRMPHLASEKVAKMVENFDSIQKSMQYYDSMSAQRAEEMNHFINSSRIELNGLCDNMGIKTPEDKSIVEDTIANIVRSDESLMRKFRSGDSSYLKEAFDRMSKTLMGAARVDAISAMADKKKKVVSLAKGTPSGGSISQTKPQKPSDEERLSMAFEQLRGSK